MTLIIQDHWHVKLRWHPEYDFDYAGGSDAVCTDCGAALYPEQAS